MIGRKRIGCLLVAVSLSVLFYLFCLFLPALLKSVLNRAVISHFIADPDVPLTGGSVETLTYHRLSAGYLTIDPAPGVSLTVPEIRAVYSPRSLMWKRVKSVEGTLVGTSGPDFQAAFQARDIRLKPAGLAADVSAKCSRIRYGDLSAGPIETAAEVQGDDVAFLFDVPIQDGLLSARVSMQANWHEQPRWKCSASVPLVSESNAPLQLAELIPGINDLQVSGALFVDAGGGASGGEAAVSVTIDSLELPADKLSLSNLSANCVLQLAEPPRSLPEQKLTLESLSFGNLLLEQIQMNYQLEPESVFFIEDLQFNWCDGQVRLDNARIRPDMKSLPVRLTCNRLSLEQVLSSFGVDGFSGDGELNGVLPVRWNKGELSIDRGFLFTTPGRGGRFAFGATEVAASLLPPGSAESGQVGLVTAALAGFEYDWITMTLNSEEEELKITVEIAGQPVRVLPYEYDSKKGVFVKVSLNKPGRGTRQPMRFKLNLSVPLNQLLCYASGINRQWNLFKGR